jgi:hypothetical protein
MGFFPKALYRLLAISVCIYDPRKGRIGKNRSFMVHPLQKKEAAME